MEQDQGKKKTLPGQVPLIERQKKIIKTNLGFSDVPYLENSSIEPVQVKIMLKKLDTIKATSTEDYPTLAQVECAEE